MLKAPPKFVTNEAAWDYTLAKLDEKGKLTEDGNPQNYAAACAIYKNVVKKYPAFSVAGNEPVYHVKSGDHNGAKFMAPSELADAFPVGESFWWQDCIVTVLPASCLGGVVIAPDGSLMLRGLVEDVDPDGPHKDWVGKASVFQASQCLPMDQA